MTCVSTHLQSKNGIKTIKNTRKVMRQIMKRDLVEEEDEPAEKRELTADALVVGEVKKDGHEGEESEEEVGPWVMHTECMVVAGKNEEALVARML
jgi:hypothetical protein